MLLANDSALAFPLGNSKLLFLLTLLLTQPGFTLQFWSADVPSVLLCLRTDSEVTVDLCTGDACNDVPETGRCAAAKHFTFHWLNETFTKVGNEVFCVY